MRFTFRLLTRTDLPRLEQWRAKPHASQWWGPAPGREALEEEYARVIDGREPTEIFTSELDGSPIGMMQRYRNLDYPDWDQQMQGPAAAGIDYFIGESSLVGRGLGPQIISRFVEQVFADYQDINAVIVGVLEANRQSWRALEKAGFERLRSQHLDS